MWRHCSDILPLLVICGNDQHVTGIVYFTLLLYATIIHRYNARVSRRVMVSFVNLLSPLQTSPVDCRRSAVTWPQSMVQVRWLLTQQFPSTYVTPGRHQRKR